MNVGEILDRVKLLIDHDLEDEQMVANMNQLSRKLFRKLPLPEAFYKFQTTAIPYYELPIDCAEDRIRCVVIDDIEYIKLTPEIQIPPACFCTVLAGAMFISPNESGKDAYLYYGPRPIELVAGDLTATPNFYEDYHDLYVYDGARYVASIQRDVDMVNNFQAEFDDILRDATRELRKMGLKRVKETTVW